MHIDGILGVRVSRIRANLDRLQICKSGSSVDSHILNEYDPPITSRCQVRLRYRHYVDSDCVCRGHVVHQILVFPEKIMICYEQWYDIRIVRFESPVYMSLSLNSPLKRCTYSCPLTSQA